MEKLAPEPDVGEPPVACQLKEPLPPDAVKLTVWPVVADWLAGEQVGGGGCWTVTVTELWAFPLTFVHTSV